MKLVLKLLSISLLLFLAACNMPLISVEIATPDAGDDPIPTATQPIVVATSVPNQPTQPAAPSNGGQTDLGDINAVGSGLAQAIETRDFTALRALMRDRFSISTFDQTLYEYPSDEALEMLRQSVLVDGSAPAVLFGTDVVALLSGADPLEQWGPVAQVVRAVHVSGLGTNAGSEAVLVIGRDSATGKFYWHGILLPAEGNFKAQSRSNPAQVVETDVRYVLAKEDINVRIGPGTTYTVNGQIWGGQIAEVHGLSGDGGWYRVFCPQDTASYCWITADPTLTEPTTAP